MLYVPTDDRLWRAAEDLLRTLGRADRQIPLGDAIVASCALRVDATVRELILR